MWLLKWWARGGELTLMLWAVSGRQEPTAPAAKSAHLSELPSLGSQVITEFLKAACRVGSCCILVSVKADREAQRIHGAAVWTGRRASQCLLKPRDMYLLLTSLHLSSSWVPVSWICLFCGWSCLLCVLVCVFISSLCDLFALCLSLHVLPPTLPWCSACCSIKMKNASSLMFILGLLKSVFGFSFLFSLMLVSAKYGWKEKKGMLKHLCQVGAGNPELPWSGCSSFIHAGRYPSCAAAPMATEATYRNQSSERAHERCRIKFRSCLICITD